jgi:hypothetical protein
MRTHILILTLACVATFALPFAAGAQTLKREPAMGAMTEGQRVLVDDGTCPKGQIKEVIGGNHTKVGGKKQIERTRRCIPRR